MSDRIDVLKSLVRTAARRAGDTLSGLGPVARAREAVREMARRRAVIREEDLTTAVAHAQGVRAASVVARDGAVRVDVTFDSGDHYAASLVPLGARFAPRGAKEILFRVEPAERARGPYAAEVAAAVATAIARSLWRGFLPREGDTHGVIVDRDDDVLRIDLRTVPAVRKLQSKGAIGMVIDVMEVQAVHAEGGTLSVELKLPQIVI